MEGEARYRGKNCVFWWMVAGRGGEWIGEVVFFSLMFSPLLLPSHSLFKHRSLSVYRKSVT